MDILEQPLEVNWTTLEQQPETGLRCTRMSSTKTEASARCRFRHVITGHRSHILPVYAYRRVTRANWADRSRSDTPLLVS
jgi:hypothetical protein